LTDGTADIFLSGSRLDGLARGGDVDLLIETDTPLSLLERVRIKMELERLIALPVDIVAHGRESAPTPVQRID
jgi:predicted nucleotidyltransferase